MLKMKRKAELERMWTGLLSEVKIKSINLLDMETIELIRRIENVTPEIRKAVLGGYLQACRRLHSIAFSQWRLRNPTFASF